MKAHIFDLSGLTTEQRTIIEDAINRCEFDTTVLLPKLQKDKNKDKIPVEFEDLSRYRKQLDEKANKGGHYHIHENGDTGHPVAVRQRVLGLAWYSGKVTIEKSLVSEPELAKEVFLAEGAHMIDFFYMTDAHRQAIFRAFHGGKDEEHGHTWFDNASYWDDVGESFMGGFTKAFAPTIQMDDSSFSHRVTPAIAGEIRSILVPKVDKYFTTKTGKTYHDLHKGLKPDRYYSTKPSGKSPCRVCKP